MDLALAPEHWWGRGALYSRLNQGRIDVARLQRALAGVQLPQAGGGRLVLAVDVSPWLRPDAGTCSDRSFCHTFGRGLGKHQMVPGWPYAIVAALETEADRDGLDNGRREAVKVCCRYLTGHLGQLRYDAVLVRGWPIATGAVEGACRHLIGDRLDITGARWGLTGAEAVLRLRA